MFLALKSLTIPFLLLLVRLAVPAPLSLLSLAVLPLLSLSSLPTTNSMPDFFADILLNPIGNFGVDASSNLAVDLVSSPTVPILSNCPTLGRFLRHDCLALAFSILGQDVPLNHPPSLGLFLLLPSLGNFTYDW